MASVYKPSDKKHWYISYKDPFTGKFKNKSTGLLASKENYKKAQEMRCNLEKHIREQESKLKTAESGITTIYKAFRDFKILNKTKHPKTIKGYDYFFDKFCESFDKTKPCIIITEKSIEDWLIELSDLEVSKNTIYAYYKVLNKFLRYLFSKKLTIPFEINQDIKPKPEVKKIVVFTDTDMELILKKFEEESKNSNFKTMISLLMYTGLRPSDIINLKVEDVDITNSVISYYSEKTDEYFDVPVYEKLIPILQNRISEVGSGRLLNYATYQEMGKAFRRYLENIGLKGKGYTLRTFRKTFATRAFESGIDIKSVSSLLGHKNLSTTMKYYTKANRKKLSEDLKKLDL